MARILKERLSGKIGKVVASEWKGETYVKSLPIRTAPPTEAEKANRYIFKLVQDWIQPLNAFVKLGFRDYSARSYGRNAAMSLLHREALHRDGFNSYIDPSRVQLSFGRLPLPGQLQVAQESEQELHFSWDPQVDRRGSPHDRAMLLAYNIEKASAVYKLHGARRIEGEDRVSLASAPVGTYHIYVAFAGDDAGQSESRYMGGMVLG